MHICIHRSQTYIAFIIYNYFYICECMSILESSIWYFGFILAFTFSIFESLFSNYDAWLKFSSLCLFIYSFNPPHISNLWTLLEFLPTYLCLIAFWLIMKEGWKKKGRKEKSKERIRWVLSYISISVNFITIKKIKHFSHPIVAETRPARK